MEGKSSKKLKLCHGSWARTIMNSVSATRAKPKSFKHQTRWLCGSILVARAQARLVLCLTLYRIDVIALYWSVNDDYPSMGNRWNYLPRKRKTIFSTTQRSSHVHDIERGCGEKASEARKALSLFPNCFYDSGIIDPALPLSPTLSYSILGDMIGFTMMLFNACLKHNCSAHPFKTK